VEWGAGAHGRGGEIDDAGAKSRSERETAQPHLTPWRETKQRKVRPPVGCKPLALSLNSPSLPLSIHHRTPGPAPPIWGSGTGRARSTPALPLAAAARAATRARSLACSGRTQRK